MQSFYKKAMKNVLITGGSRGIGAELVREFSDAGYGVYFLYKSSDGQAQALGIQTGATPIKCDVSKEEDVRRAFQTLHEKCYKIDVLVNNAGIASIKPFLDVSSEQWHEMMGVCLDGAFYCTGHAVKDMLKEKWGRIINISSMWGQVGSSCEVAYSTAKAGLIGMTKALAKELGPSGITVNCIAPGVVETDMVKCLGEEVLKELADETPLCRNGKPEEIAKLALFLAEDNFITGQILAQNGGFVI